ncbi:MAG: ABC transporter permease [Bacteroidia bacterium]|nr:ABC transporter permease [Bacteroidia bacterium]NNF30303.1 ABC transporter permease [Flavobacteriaceae bacterium]MBT8276379.1 ABC transporter permease [Bacteroidia bacterium]NNJ80978.1 ABC transporter permease [Flavobacteriaceae bacterium]NNK53552.1 ABC transporter permease [Flavobacteriaceae bacterium]
MNHLSLIIKREYLNKVKNRAFIIMTFLSPLIMVGIFTLVAYLSQLNNDKVRTIAVLDESGMFSDEFESGDNLKYKLVTGSDLSEAKKAVEASGDYGLLYIAEVDSLDALSENITFYSEDSPSFILLDNIEDAIAAKANTLKLQEAGLDPAKIESLRIRIEAKLETFGGEKTSKLSTGLKLGFGGLAGYLLFMFIIIYGNMIMRSVIEEKTSRIIEVIISSVKPVKLLLGKIIGTSMAGVTQFLAWVILIGVFGMVISAIFGIDAGAMQQQEAMAQAEALSNDGAFVQDIMMELNNLPILNLVIMFILFFVGGYLLYASLYAAIGAAVDSETDTQQFMLPIIMPLILAVYVGFFTVIDNPHGTVSQVFSFIPFTSPVVMLMRIPFGVPLWQQILSVVILFATFMGTVWFAAKIYRVGILMYGKKASYKELIKWLKY